MTVSYQYNIGSLIVMSLIQNAYYAIGLRASHVHYSTLRAVFYHTIYEIIVMLIIGEKFKGSPKNT